MNKNLKTNKLPTLPKHSGSGDNTLFIPVLTLY